MAEFFHNIAQHYQHYIVDTGKQPQAVILLSFLVMFILVRLITYRIHRRGLLQTEQARDLSATHEKHLLGDVSVRGIHIHHLVWGILLLLVTGYIAIAFDPPGQREFLALLFGIGAALTLDEFALWLRLEDVYWTKAGRGSVDAVIIVAVILAFILLGLPFWQAVSREIQMLF